MVLKSGYDRGKEREPEYRKKCTNCGVEKDKREFDINQIQAGDAQKNCASFKKLGSKN